jgi:ribosomal protein S27AE
MGKCPRCGKTVYFAERQTGPDGGEWHQICVQAQKKEE